MEIPSILILLFQKNNLELVRVLKSTCGRFIFILPVAIELFFVATV